MQKKSLFLFDIMPLLYRAHFATMGKKFGTTTGIDTRTTLVFYNYIFQVLTEEKPDAVAAALDSRPKERVAVSSTYKANREKMPSEIAEAFPYAIQLLESLRIPILKVEGYEADDVIASLAKEGAGEGYKVFIVSPDKDFAQLVTDNIFLFRPAYKGAVMETLDVEGVRNKYGVSPGQIADYLALRGDSVDNIIGVKGIGDKTAAQLLSEFNSVEELIHNADRIKQQKVKEAIIAYKGQLVENKKLAVLSGDLEVPVEWENLSLSAPDEIKLLSLLNELQFVRIKERLVNQGFLKVDEEQESIETAEVEVIKLAVEEAVQKCKNEKIIVVGFSEKDVDVLFLMSQEASSIIEVVISNEQQWHTLIGFLDTDQCTKVGWQLKPLLKKIVELKVRLKSKWIDLSLAAYLLEPDAKIEWAYIKDKYELSQLPVAAPYSSFSYLSSLHEANKKIMSKIDQMGLSSLLLNIELPLQTVIARMETYGIRIDTAALKEIDQILSKQLNELEKKLYEAANTKFNIDSTTQTAEILQKIADPAELTKTKTGRISTAEPHLAALASKYPFVEDLLLYRKLNKIITTYVYSLPKYINTTTHKVHPTFQQVVAGTGRIICTEPNLQNLPVRSEAGREVRKAVVPSKKGYSILSIDYNQVELRLLAALSEDAVMVETFRL
jgi:DNA polymerase-1